MRNVQQTVVHAKIYLRNIMGEKVNTNESATVNEY